MVCLHAPLQQVQLSFRTVVQCAVVPIAFSCHFQVPVMSKSKSRFDLNHDWITCSYVIWRSHLKAHDLIWIWFEFIMIWFAIWTNHKRVILNYCWRNMCRSDCMHDVFDCCFSCFWVIIVSSSRTVRISKTWNLIKIVI